MARLVTWLKIEKNRALVGWLGGGAVVAIGGLWSAYLHFHPTPEGKPDAPPKQIEADCGSVAIGGDVTGATVTAGANANCPQVKKPDQ